MSAKAITALSNRALAPVKVHLIPGLLEKIAELVLEGYAATSHGGLEIGGLLFGRRRSDFVSVEDFRPLACDHSLGPRFILSDADEQSLRELLLASTEEPALRDLFIVGWYCSHTRSDLLLLDRELALHDTYFSSPDDFVIIFKPSDLRNVTAGIFLRGADGTLDPHCPGTILELPELPATRRAGRTATNSACDLATFSHSTSFHSASPSAKEPALALPGRLSAIERSAADQPVYRPMPVLADAAPKPGKNGRSSAKWKILLAALGMIVLLCLGVWRYLQDAEVSPANLSLGLRPHAGKLLLSWKTNAVTPRRARVDIIDGPLSEHVNITDIFQPSGVLLFTHNTGNVQAVLTVETANSVVVRHASFADTSAAAKVAVASENHAETGPRGMDIGIQQQPSKLISSKRPARQRHSRRTRQKRANFLSAAAQPR
jgi:hypothetical protein